MTSLDPRLNAFRGDLADARLKGTVEAVRFNKGRMARVSAPVADMRKTPSPTAGIETQLLFGDEVTVFDRASGFAWVQSARDGYVGYVAARDLGKVSGKPTHRVAATRSFVYPGSDMKRPPAASLSMGSALAVTDFEERRGTNYALLAGGGAMIASHLTLVDAHAADYVAIAEALVRTPYLWGGASAFGLDCSGLVQLSMLMAGMSALRDSDMQAAGLGSPIDGHRLKRGDLVFWKGHVAIVAGPNMIIHANGHTMDVAYEPLDKAVARIGYLYGQPTGYRRP